MTQPADLPRELTNPLENKVADLRAELRGADPWRLATTTGAIYEPAPAGEGGAFRLHVWGQPTLVSFPDFEGHDAASGRPLFTLMQAMLAYYFNMSENRPLTGRWVAFSELPNGTFYTQAFQGYTGQKLLQEIREDYTGFEQAAMASGGQRVAFADAAFAFRAMPYVALLVACWQGDEDFSPSYRVLFDAACSHHLSTDGCAILGSMLTKQLIKDYRTLRDKPPAQFGKGLAQ